MTNLTLYQINSELLTLLVEIENAEKAGLQVPEEMLLKKQEKLNELATKGDNCFLFNKFIDSQIDFIKQEMNHLKEEKERFEAMQEKFHSYLMPIIEQKGGELKGNMHRLKVSGRDSVKVINESQIPAEYFRVETISKLDKRKLLEEMKAGVILDGCSLEKSKFILFK